MRKTIAKIGSEKWMRFIGCWWRRGSVLSEKE